MPVIIFCSDPLAIQKQLPEALLFTGDEVGELNELLKFLKTSSNAIVLTTSADSKGVDFVFATPQAFVIHTVLPKSLVQLKQDSGRGVRGNDMPIVGALFTAKMYFTLQGVELGLSHAEQFDKLYPADYLKSLQFLEKLPTPSTDPQQKTMEAVVAALNEGKSFAHVCCILSKLPVFKKMLPEFAVPVNKSTSSGFGMLGKRTPPKQQEEEKSSVASQWQSPAKRQAREPCCLLDHELVGPMRAPFAAVACQQCSKKTKEQLYHCSGCKKYYCYLCHETAAQEKLAGALEDLQDGGGPEGDQVSGDAEMMHQDASIMNQSVGGLSEAVVEDLERQQYQALHAKFGGQQACSGTASPQSKTSSQILFGGDDNVSESSVGIHRKKRDQKQWEKESVKSGGSKYSKRSMKKEDVIVDESKWKKLEEKDKYRATLYQCVSEGCDHKTRKCDRWKHVCQYLS